MNGVPIIGYPIMAARNAGLPVYVTSDDMEILGVAGAFGAVPHQRPAHLAGDDISEIHAYREVIENMERRPEYFVACYATAALLTTETITGALDHLQKTGADVCMGVTPFRELHPYQCIVPEGQFWRLRVPGLNEQTPYPPACASNGSIYVFRTAPFMLHPTYFPAKLTVYETQAVDINTQEDFDRLERAMK